MVEFILRDITSERLLYEYYPEGNRNRMSGLISVMLKGKDVILEVAAEDDFKCSLKDELEELKDSIDEMYEAIGTFELAEDWDIDVGDDEWYYYADKVIESLKQDLLQRKMKKRGVIVWQN